MPEKLLYETSAPDMDVPFSACKPPDAAEAGVESITADAKAVTAGSGRMRYARVDAETRLHAGIGVRMGVNLLFPSLLRLPACLPACLACQLTRPAWH